MGERIMKELTDFPIDQFQGKLLYWFERNMRSLPWRQDRDPYKIWVSEIMLQQTRVDTVIPYFQRFMEKFPTLHDLADAEEEEVLKQWEGLGYYSRARNLQTAVKEVKEEYGGKVPEDLKEISKLKGVGPYTAGAILSIAYGKPEPAVDGNVMRVFSRIFHIEEDIQKVKTRKTFEELIRQLIPKDHASYFNQGIMELGALICSPKSPNCEACPVNEMCQAKAKGVQHELPVKKKKTKPKKVKMAAGVLIHDDQVLLRKRPETGLLAKLYDFPNVEWQGDPVVSLSQFMYETYDLECETIKSLPSVQHTFSHLIWDITVYQLSLVYPHKVKNIELPKDSFWVNIKDLEKYPFPVSHQKIKQSFNLI